MSVNHALKIRRAERRDCPRLLELVKELALYERAPEKVTVTLEHFAESGFGSRPVWWAFVAEDERGIHGFALYYIRYSTWRGQRMYLEDLYVTETERGRGMGKMLMDRLMEEARERKFSGMMWQVLDWNQSAIEFYKNYRAEFDHEWVNCSIEFAP